MEGNESQNNMSSMPAQSSSSSIWIWLIVAVVVLAGLAYFWNERSGEPVANPIESQSNSDEILDIQADLEATDVDSVDYDLSEENYNAS